MSYFRNLKWEMVLYSALCILMGVLLMIFSGTILNTICYILAATLGILGVRYIIEYRSKDLINGIYKYELVVGIILFILAAFIIIKKDFVISIIPFIIGIIIVISGAMKVENAFDLKRMGSHWITLMILAVINVVLGVFILANPQDTAVFVIKITGGVLIYSGVIDLITTLMISGKIKQYVNNNEYVDEDIIDVDE